MGPAGSHYFAGPEANLSNLGGTGPMITGTRRSQAGGRRPQGRHNAPTEMGWEK